MWDEAVKISGADSDFHRRDLWEAIEASAYPEWELGLQIFTEERAALMDLAMPVLDGREAIQLLASDPITARIPVLAMSAQPNSLTNADTRPRFLPKPADPEHLLPANRLRRGYGGPPKRVILTAREGGNRRPR